MNEKIEFPDIEEFIEAVFSQNYEIMRFEQGRALAPDVLAEALKHVQFYWKKSQEIAESVTDTEVRLTLPQVESPADREYTIEGVVDIVRDDDQTIMFDIKTHDADYVRGNIDQYMQQLNIYAYVWQGLRNEKLDKSALICTDYPIAIREAIESGYDARIEKAFEEWEPIVEIKFNRGLVDQTIRSFGEVVDRIEEREFSPPDVDVLKEQITGGKQIFAVHVCRNCDARFSCPPYRAYGRQGRGRAEHDFNQYFIDLDVTSGQDNWRTVNLDASVDAEILREDFS